MARSVWVIHGPNLNLLGVREPELYGREGLAAMNKRLAKLGETLGLQVQSFQSNHEGALVDLLTVAMEEADGCVLNPAALSHTSMALADTLRAMTIPVVEVHLTNLYARESGRHESLTAAASSGVVMGFGPLSYELGLRALTAILGAPKARRKSR